MKELYYDFLFPTLVVYSDNKDVVTKELLEISKKLVEEHGSEPFYSKCKSTVDTFGYVLELSEFSEIKDFISSTIGGFCEINKINSDSLRFTCSWLNEYELNGYQDLHAHPDSMLSGVFYIESDEKKDLIFQAPWHFLQPRFPRYNEVNLTNCHNIEYESRIGRCYLFPSHLMHRTMPATSNRLSLSFNVAYK